MQGTSPLKTSPRPTFSDMTCMFICFQHFLSFKCIRSQECVLSCFVIGEEYPTYHSKFVSSCFVILCFSPQLLRSIHPLSRAYNWKYVLLTCASISHVLTIVNKSLVMLSKMVRNLDKLFLHNYLVFLLPSNIVNYDCQTI